MIIADYILFPLTHHAANNQEKVKVACREIWQFV
jgi:hypothetical protein